MDGKIRRESLKDVVAGEIRQRIFSGRLTPGTRVNQEQLADELGISKLPIREALITLDSEGLVRIIARRGAFVAALTREDVLDHFHVFGLVAGLAAERAASTLTDEEIDELEAILDRMDASASEEEKEALNDEFHRLINVAGGSRRLASVLRLLAQSLPSRFFQANERWSTLAQDDHREILRALRERDAIAARDALSGHLRRSGEQVVENLEVAGFWHEDDGGGQSEHDDRGTGSTQGEAGQPSRA